MNKEELLKAIESVPKIDSINPISAYNSINVEDLANAVDRFKKVPTYDELLKENKKYKELIDKAIEYINDNLIISSILDGKKYYTINNYSFDYRELLEILDDKEVE